MNTKLFFAIFLLPYFLWAQPAAVYNIDLRQLLESKSVTFEWPKLDGKNALYLSAFEDRNLHEEIRGDLVAKRANGICKLLGIRYRALEYASAEAHAPYEKISKVLVDWKSGIPVDREVAGNMTAVYTKKGGFPTDFTLNNAIYIFKSVKCKNDD